MIYGYELPVLYNSIDVFNPTTANMVLQSMGQYAEVLLREHERALQDEKDFIKEYGDFVSAVPGATEAFYNESIGKVRNALAIALQNGIDLTRSPEGRAVLSRIINSVDVGKLNLLRQQKEAYDLFLKSAADALQRGYATPEYISNLLENHGLDNFSAIKDGLVLPWTLTSVPKYETIDAFSDRIFNDIKNTYLGTENEFDYTGVGKEQMKSALDISLPAYLNTPSGEYEMQAFLSSLPDGGVNMTPDLKLEAFGNDILSRALDRYSHSTRDLNPIWELNEKLKNQKDLIDYRHSNGGSGDGGNSEQSGDNIKPVDDIEYGYSHKLRYFNEGFAKLLGVKASTVSVARKNTLAQLSKNQSSIMKNHLTTANGEYKYSATGILNELSIPYTISEVAQIIGLKQIEDDAQNGVYSIDRPDLSHAYSGSEIFNSMYGAPKESVDSPAKKNSQEMKDFIKNATDVKAVPTGQVVTYLKKDYTLKTVAKVILHLSTETGGDKTAIAWVDMGINSNKITNNPDIPIAIDNDRSTLRNANWNDVNKKYSSNLTKSITTDFGTYKTNTQNTK